MKIKQKELSRRSFVFGGIQLLAATALTGRLGYLQLLKSGEYATLAENNRIKLQLVPPDRGNIVDRNGVEIALNERNFQFFVDVTSLKRKEVKAYLQKIAEIVPLTEAKINELIKSIQGVSFPAPLLLRENLSWEEVVNIEMHSLDLPGAYIHTGQKRFYPFAQDAAHLIGYVGAVSPEEVVDDQPLLRLPDFKIGKNGIEKMLEEKIRGSAGIRQIEVNVHGLAVREISNRKSVAGKNIKLTIDSQLQQFTSQRIADESASVVVMNIENGDILTLASMPAFDPNVFSVGILSDYWNELNSNKRLPLMNKAVQGQYPPGSTFKMVTGLAGLREKAITEASRIHCPGHFYLGNHRFNCWKEGGHGSMDIKQALAQSCDTFFYTIANRIGIEPIAKTARELGLGTDENLGFPGEKSGIVPDEEWKMKKYKDKWRAGDSVNVGIGQGYIIATPLQLCVMTARLASGRLVVPRLFETEPLVFAEFETNQEYMALIRSGMEAAVNNPYGTAYGKRIEEKGLEMAGKTGTSQVRKITIRGQDQNTIPWEMRHHAFFVGYAPLENPKYAICVAVEHGGGGSAAAAPIARDVLLKTQELMA